MSPMVFRYVCLCVSVAAAATAWASAQEAAPGEPPPVSITRGSVSFEVATNMFGTTVRGKSSALTGTTTVRDGPSGLRLAQIRAALPVATLRTGIALRDRHMLDYIFRTADGDLPDVRFTADSTECVRSPATRGYTCAASGMLVIRNTPRPFTMSLDVSQDGTMYRVKGAGRIALSDYGIERPSQLGVRTEDEVSVRVELSARAAPANVVRGP